MCFNLSLQYSLCLSSKVSWLAVFYQTEKEGQIFQTRDCFHIACDESEFEKRTETRGMGQHNKQARKLS